MRKTNPAKAYESYGIISILGERILNLIISRIDIKGIVDQAWAEFAAEIDDFMDGVLEEKKNRTKLRKKKK